MGITWSFTACTRSQWTARGAKRMSAKIVRSAVPLPDHTQLPAEDGAIVHNFEELKQSMLLTDCLEPVLERLHPDGRYCIGQDTGIYWRLPAPGEPAGEAAIAPDWFYVPGVAPGSEGRIFRSYVLWQEKK